MPAGNVVAELKGGSEGSNGRPVRALNLVQGLRKLSPLPLLCSMEMPKLFGIPEDLCVGELFFHRVPGR